MSAIGVDSWEAPGRWATTGFVSIPAKRLTQRRKGAKRHKNTLGVFASLREIRLVNHRFFATCARGLEPVLAGELHELGAANVQPGRGGVAFVGDKALLYKANL